MARIVVQSEDGKRTLLDERHVTMAQLDDLESATEVLDRLTWAIRDADRRLCSPRRPATKRRSPRKRIATRQSYLTVNGA